MVFTAKKVEGLPSFGEKLKKAREEAGLTKEKVAQLLNWQTKYLERLEKGELEKLPPDVYAKGFLRKYAAMLGLEADSILREYETESKITRHLSRTGEHQSLPTLPSRRLVITPKTLAWLVGTIAMVLVVGYLIYQLHFLISPPSLVIFEPAADVIVVSPEVFIKGQTEPGAKLTINNQLTNIDKDGNFEQAVNLNQGLNVVKIEATNRFRKSSSVVRQIMLK